MDETDRMVLERIINHVFLPRGLPNMPDKSSIDDYLLDRFISSVSEFALLCNGHDKEEVDKLKSALQIFQGIRKDDGSLESDQLRTAMQQAVGQSKCPFLPRYLFHLILTHHQAYHIFLYTSKLKMPLFSFKREEKMPLSIFGG